MYSRLFDHLVWADDNVVAAIVSLPERGAERAQAVHLYAHLAGASHVWLSRLRAQTPVHAVWPELPLEAARALMAETLLGLREFASRDAAGLAEEVEYRNRAGKQYRNTVGDILAHLLLHGSHHRGQLAMLARQGGGTPAGTDYIAYLWEMADA